MNKEVVDSLYKEFSLYLKIDNDLLYDLCKIIVKKIPKSMAYRVITKLYKIRSL